METATMFCAAFVGVALKSTQQLNVFKAKYWMIVPVSFGMALCGVIEIKLVSDMGVGFNTVLPIGLGGGLGSMLATWMHGRIFKTPSAS